MDMCIEKVETALPVIKPRNSDEFAEKMRYRSGYRVHKSILRTSKQWQKRVQATQNFSVF